MSSQGLSDVARQIDSLLANLLLKGRTTRTGRVIQCDTSANNARYIAYQLGTMETRVDSDVMWIGGVDRWHTSSFDPGSGMETVRPRLNTDQAIYFILFISFYGRLFLRIT